MAKWNMSDKPAKVDLRTIDKPFGELDERTQRRLRKAAIRGWPIEFRDLKYAFDTWDPCDDPGFSDFFAYRLDPSFTPPPKRRVVWVVNGTVFFTKKAAKIAYPGEKLPKFKECRE